MMIRCLGGIPWLLEYFVENHHSSRLTGKAINDYYIDGIPWKL